MVLALRPSQWLLLCGTPVAGSVRSWGLSRQSGSGGARGWGLGRGAALAWATHSGIVVQASEPRRETDRHAEVGPAVCGGGEDKKREARGADGELPGRRSWLPWQQVPPLL